MRHFLASLSTYGCLPLDAQDLYGTLPPALPTKDEYDDEDYKPPAMMDDEQPDTKKARTTKVSRYVRREARVSFAVEYRCLVSQFSSHTCICTQYKRH